MIIQTPNGLFDDVGDWAMHQLMIDFTLVDFQAAGLLGNLGYESNGFKTLQEVSPVVPGSAGGYGWAQWTGPRRRNFTKFCSENNLDISTNTANLNFLEYELKNTTVGRKTLVELRKATTLEEAVFSVGRYYETPLGTTDSYLPGYEGRLRWARRVLNIPAIKAIKESTEKIQQTLNRQGYILRVDGELGPLTYAALTDWKKQI